MATQITLDFSSGKPTLTGVDAVNAELRKVGVHVEFVPLPASTLEARIASVQNPLCAGECAELLSAFAAPYR